MCNYLLGYGRANNSAKVYKVKYSSIIYAAAILKIKIAIWQFMFDQSTSVNKCSYLFVKEEAIFDKNVKVVIL